MITTMVESTFVKREHAVNVLIARSYRPASPSAHVARRSAGDFDLSDFAANVRTMNPAANNVGRIHVGAALRPRFFPLR